MEIAVQLIIAGILQGGVYALAAFGLSLIFGVSDVLNLAHGEFLMLGGLFTYLLFTLTGTHALRAQGFQGGAPAPRLQEIAPPGLHV